jgi:hypothetical protein
MLTQPENWGISSETSVSYMATRRHNPEHREWFIEKNIFLYTN